MFRAYFLAGLWPLFWHFTLGTLIIAGALAWAWFMPVFKKTALWVAATTFVIMTAYATGVKNENTRWEAKWDAANAAAVAMGEHARRDADRDITNGVCDPSDTDHDCGNVRGN